MNSKGQQLYNENKNHNAASFYLSDQAWLNHTTGDFKTALEYEKKLYDFNINHYNLHIYYLAHMHNLIFLI